MIGKGTMGPREEDTEKAGASAGSDATDAAMHADKEEALLAAAPHFEEGAAVQALAWTDGGGMTGRHYGNGSPLALIAGPLTTKVLSNGATYAGYLISCQQRTRPLFWPAEKLAELHRRYPALHSAAG